MANRKLKGHFLFLIYIHIGAYKVHQLFSVLNRNLNVENISKMILNYSKYAYLRLIYFVSIPVLGYLIKLIIQVRTQLLSLIGILIQLRR